MLSEASGASVDTTALSHLRAWQDIVTSKPHNTALISYHQNAGDFCWLSGNDTAGRHLRWTYSDLDRAARRLATTLNRLVPVHKRPIAVLVDNQAEWLLFFWAAAYLHSPLAPINPKCASRKEEVKHMIEVVQPAVIVAASSSIAERLDQSLDDAIKDIAVKIVLDSSQPTSWRTLTDIMMGELTPPDTPTYSDPLETAVILFTSGTTSLPKPCGISSAQTANAAFVYIEPRNIVASHKYISHLPNFHSYGIGWMLTFLLTGGTVVLPSKTFEAQATLECIERFGATHMSLVPTTAQTIMAHPVFAKTNISTLVGIDLSGAGIVPSVLDACEANFSVPIGSSYGMTESPTTLIWHTADGRAFRSGQVSSGKPSRGARVKICEPGSRAAIPRGLPGELHTGGVQVIRSYLYDTVAPDTFYIDDDGCPWITTGDQAVMDDDDNIRISGRYKDLIIRGGENISPASIEACLQKHAGIFIAQVVGISDDIAGEVPIAVVQNVGTEQIPLDELKAETTRTLGPAFAPKMILRLQEDLGMDSFPTTAAGKIRKVELLPLVQQYLTRLRGCDASASGSTVETLIKIWTNISGAKTLLPQTTIQSFADSLMMMQLSAIVKKILHKDVTVERYKECITIQDQSNLIDSSEAYSKPSTKPKRQGPPTMTDIPHLHNHEEYYSMKSSVVAVLQQHHLRWDDVEEIVPLPDWSAIFAHRCRPQSWNLRWSYHAKVDCARLQDAMRVMLEYHPALRSTIVDVGEELPLLVSLKANDRWFSAAMTSGHVVDTKEGLDKILLDDPILDSAVIDGPQFRIHIASIRADGTSGVAIIGSHAVCDMSMTKLWLDDVAAFLNNSERLVDHVSFFDYSRAFNKHRTGCESLRGVQYWTRKLQGIGSLPETTHWPPQRGPEFFKGNDAGWRRWNGHAGRPQDRQVPLHDKLQAQQGLRRVVKIADIALLKAEHDVPIFMLVKAGITLMNIKRTSAKEVVFGTLNAARTWPFSSDYSPAERALYSENPLDISGSTTEYVLDRIEVDRSRSVVDFMKFITNDEERNSPFVKAPMLRVIDALRDPLDDADLRSWTERERDAEAVLTSIRRQSFNWLPTPPGAQDHECGLQATRFQVRMDNGLTIGGFLADDKCSVVVTFSWDAEHLTMSEAEAAIDDLAQLIAMLGQKVNWSRSVDEVILSL